MKRNSTDLYPMRVNPFNFSKGDVVKKIITDSIRTPYTGIVIAIVPATNKVIVQWPNGEGYEDPWDLIKVNPIIQPPVVNQNKEYPSFQNELSHRYYEKIKPYRIVEDFVKEEFNPILSHLANLYNEGYSKSAAFENSLSKFDNKRLIQEGLDKVYSDNVEIQFAKDIVENGERKSYVIRLTGDSDHGFNLVVVSGNKRKNYFFDCVCKAVEQFKKFKDIISGLKSEEDYAKVVHNVLSKLKKS